MDSIYDLIFLILALFLLIFMVCFCFYGMYQSIIPNYDYYYVDYDNNTGETDYCNDKLMYCDVNDKRIKVKEITYKCVKNCEDDEDVK